MFYDTSDLRTDEIFLKLDKTAEGNLEKGWADAYYLKICLISCQTEVGECVFRVGNIEKLFFGGNIGYGVHENYRGNKYAGKACMLLFKLAKRHGMKYLYITCDPDNYASRRTCEYAGGQLKTIIELPTDNDMYKKGSRQKCIYFFEI